MTTTTRQTWTRNAPGNYTNGRFVVRRLDAINNPKGAGPRWHVYRDGRPTVSLSDHQTLQEAQSAADLLLSMEPGRTPRTWDATASETHRCAGACGQTLPAKSFPTTGTPGRRGVVCRADRDAARTTA